MKKSLVFLALVVTSKVFAYGTGISTYPLEAEDKLIGAELTGITSSGGGMGLQTRYTQKINEKATFDAGLGISGGEHSARAFLGTDVMLFPDFESQPRVSVKGFLENSKEFGVRRNILGLAPTFSKGYSFWGHEAYPYLSIPYGISLDGSRNSYQTTMSANLGVSGLLPKEWSGKQITANAEAVLSMKNSYSGFFVGFAYPIE